MVNTCPVNPIHRSVESQFLPLQMLFVLIQVPLIGVETGHTWEVKSLNVSSSPTPHKAISQTSDSDFSFIKKML